MFDQEDVVGFEVAVDDPGAMHHPQRRRDLRADPCHPRGRQPLTPTPLSGERQPAQQLHDDKHGPVARADIVKRDDVAMMQLARGPGFATQTLHRVGIVHDLWLQDLERDLALQHAIQPRVHDRHPARAEPSHNLVATGEHLPNASIIDGATAICSSVAVFGAIWVDA